MTDFLQVKVLRRIGKGLNIRGVFTSGTDQKHVPHDHSLTRQHRPLLLIVIPLHPNQRSLEPQEMRLVMRRKHTDFGRCMLVVNSRSTVVGLAIHSSPGPSSSTCGGFGGFQLAARGLQMSYGSSPVVVGYRLTKIELVSPMTADRARKLRNTVEQDDHTILLRGTDIPSNHSYESSVTACVLLKQNKGSINPMAYFAYRRVISAQNPTTAS